MTATIITLCNQKAGDGKTTTAVNLAHALALSQRQVLLIDLDPQGQCAARFGMDSQMDVFYFLTTPPTAGRVPLARQWTRDTGRDRIKLMPGNSKTTSAQMVVGMLKRPVTYLRDLIRSFNKDVDIILFDTSPTLSLLQEQAVWAADQVIIPAATEAASLDSVSQTLELLHAMRVKKGWRGRLLGILPTFCDGSRESKETLLAYQSRFAGQVLAPIHLSTAVRDSSAEGQTIFESAPGSRSAEEYQALARILTQDAHYRLADAVRTAKRACEPDVELEYRQVELMPGMVGDSSDGPQKGASCDGFIKATYRGVPQAVQETVSDIARQLGVTHGDVMRSLIGFSVEAYHSGQLPLVAYPGARHNTFFPDLASPGQSSPGRNRGRSKAGYRSTRRRRNTVRPLWDYRVTCRIPALSHEAIKMIAARYDVTAGEVVWRFILHAAAAFQDGRLTLKPVPKVTGNTLAAA